MNGLKSNKKMKLFKKLIPKNDAKEYEKQLISSAKFLGTWVDTEIYKN